MTRDLDQELLQHAGALRGIARDLLRDGHLAEDMAQETMHRALLQRELEPGPLGGWLYRTVVNFTRQWRRSERRRVERESRVLARPPEASPPETLGRRETLQAVTSAVLALDEPYQTAIFLRYFEDLPPRKIAQRTGANLATVKSRLQRGLVMLRQNLNRSARGDGRSLCLSLLSTFGLPASSVAAGLTLITGAVFVATKTKLLIAAALLCASGLFVYGTTRDTVPDRIDNAAVSEDLTAAPAVTHGERDAPVDPVREAADAKVDSTAWLDHPFTFELEVYAVDPLGLPVSGHELRLAPLDCVLDSGPSSTDGEGRASLMWRSRRSSGEVVLADARSAVRRIALQHGVKASVTLLVAAVEGPRLRFSVQAGSVSGQAVETLFTGLSLGGGRPAMGPGLHPHAVFATTAETPPQEQNGPTLSLGPGFSLEGLTFDASTMEIKFAPGEAAAGSEPVAARIAGTVFGEDGKPAGELPVVLLGAGPQPVQRQKTDASGQFVFEKVPAGDYTVRAGGTDAGLATCAAITTTGTTPVTLNLQRGSCVRGTARDAEGQPIAKATVEWRADDGSFGDATTTGDDGSFLLANLPGSVGSVRLWLPGDERRFAAVVVANVLCDGGPLALVPEKAQGALVVNPVLPDGVQGQVTIRVWHTETATGLTMPRGKPREPRRLGNLAAGWYQVEVSNHATGWLDAGRHFVDGKGDCDLGSVILLAPAVVSFEFDEAQLPPEGERAFEVCRLRADLDVRIAGCELAAGASQLLPAGDYVLAWKDRAGAIRFHRFAAPGGKGCVVRPGG